jgi:type IV secretory pathway TraG/TraD family ATPase VirD4
MVLIAIFQSWAQISEAFTRDGAEKLWSAANVRIYGGGVSDTAFLKRLSDLGGEYDHVANSWSTSRHGGTRSRSTQRRAIYDVATLAALPQGRAFVQLSATRPVMCELIAWWEGPHRDLIATSAARPLR